MNKVKTTKLQFLFDINTRKNTRGWTLDKAYKFVNAIKRQEECVDFSLVAKETKMSISGCRFLLLELKKAAREGMTLESYFRKGRPYRAGKKVMA